jgi:hypothetical protein
MSLLQIKQKSRPPPRRNSRINWGTIILTKNGNSLESLWAFTDQVTKRVAIKQANSRVLENKDPNVKKQVSIYYGVDTMSIARDWS